MTIPVIGPLPGKGPLMIGSDLMLESPTPGQWLQLEEALVAQQKHIAREGATGIDAAPLVAIIDTVTGENEVEVNGKSVGRYATIAAVVGISSSTKSIDMTDSASFMESIVIANGSKTPVDSRIRLVGIGRAVVNDFFYKVPSTVAETMMDEDGYMLLDEEVTVYCYEDKPEELWEEVDVEPTAKIIMAKFSVLTDVDQSTDGERRSSPVHALNAMSTLAGQVNYMHETRRKLVNGLKAAKARLRLREQARREALEEELVDHDGIGALFAAKERQATQPAVEQLLHDFREDPAQEKEERPPSELAGMDNYGMGSSASSISSITDLTQVWLDKLKPYYSPARRESEEHYFETLSHVAMMSLSNYLTDHDLGTSLRCRNTKERLQSAYDFMYAHVQELRKEAAAMSQQLRECGEECTDLF